MMNTEAFRKALIRVVRQTSLTEDRIDTELVNCENN